MTLSELRDQYKELSGDFADGRWKEPRLAEEVSRLLEAKAEKEAEAAEAERQKQVAKEMREARITARGPLEEFIQNRYSDFLSESDQRFAFSLRRAVLLIEKEKTSLEKFDEVQAEDTKYRNGHGFRPCHARMGVSMAKFYEKNGYLSPKQVKYWRARDKAGNTRIGIYAGQLLREFVK